MIYKVFYNDPYKFTLSQHYILSNMNDAVLEKLEVYA